MCVLDSQFFFFFFFFSSRRRHTRFDCDWSSDVCSSDLDTVYSYQTGWDPRWERYSVGTVLMGLMIRRAIERGYRTLDRKSTRLNSSHSQISYAVFCLKKKKNET